MATKKISELSAAAALDGTEITPIVQDGATVQVTLNAIASLTQPGEGGLTVEDVHDALGAMLIAGDYLVGTYNDTEGTYQLDVTGVPTTETISDTIASVLTAGDNITLTYNDDNNTLTIDATGGGEGGGLTAEEVQDIVGQMITVGDRMGNSTMGPNLMTTYDDTEGTFTISTIGIPTNAVTSEDVTSIVTLTQSEYDALDPPDSTTLYIISG